MHFKDITIRNFRGLKNLSLEGFKRINLFVGKNNSGKTSVLESIFLITGMSNPKLAVNVDNFRRLIHTESDDFRFIFHNMNYRNQIQINANMISEDSNRKLKIKPIYGSRSGQIEGPDGLKRVQPDIDTNTEVDTSIGLTFEFSNKEKLKSTQEFSAEILWDNFENALKVNPSKKKYSEKLYGIFLTPNAKYKDVGKKLEQIIINKEKDLILDILKSIDSNISDFHVLRNDLIWLDTGLNILSPANIMGDGIVKVLEIVSALYDAKNGLVFIDEIENGFHYSAHKAVWEKIILLSQKLNIQLFVSTHSGDSIGALSQVLNSFSGKEEILSLYFLQKKNDEVKSVSYSLEELNSSLKNEIEIR